MLIGNILLGLITLCMVVLVVGATYAFFYFRKKITLKEGPMVIEVESLHPSLSHGYGFIVDGKIILKDDKSPFLLKTEEEAIETLTDMFQGKGDVVYQKWDSEKQQLILGSVRTNGTN